ncbi:hypothetical protein TRVL_06308 [Trypanosoma vivax]|nr:hypothetical protein TRVL_06308 [Trypanosoma vivax]
MGAATGNEGTQLCGKGTENDSARRRPGVRTTRRTRSRATHCKHHRGTENKKRGSRRKTTASRRRTGESHATSKPTTTNQTSTDGTNNAPSQGAKRGDDTTSHRNTGNVSSRHTGREEAHRNTQEGKADGHSKTKESDAGGACVQP